MVELFGKKCDFKGDLGLLDRPKVSIVGSRRPNSYTKEVTFRLAKGFVERGWVVVSGGAMGVDAMAHRGAGAANTIVVLPCGIEHRYPKVNAKLIDEVATKGLVISQFEDDFLATPWSFVVRNELVVQLGDFLIVTQADRNSGSMRSVEFAKEHQKDIYVLPHRIGESEGTNELAESGEAQVIWQIEPFLDRFGSVATDPFISYLQSTPSYEEALLRYGDRITELEITGAIQIKDGKIYYKGEG